MRILLVANTLPPHDISGVGEQVLQLAAGLREEGHKVEVLGRGRDGAGGPKLLFPLLVVPAFLRRLYRFRPHVVQVHESDGAVAALLTKVLAATLDPQPQLCALLQVSYIEEFRAVHIRRHDGRVLARPGWAERRFQWFKAPLQIALGALTAWLADRVLAPSRRTAGEIAADYRVSPVAVLPNVTGGLGRTDSEIPALARDDLLLFVGRLRIRKGVDVLLEAFAGLAGDHPEGRLAIVGDGEQRRALEALASELRLEERVELLGRQSPEQVRRLMATARALVVPSVYEGMPLVILEAMNRELPIVASAVSGIPEVVVEGETGWLVPTEAVSPLADALREVLADADECRRRGTAGRRRVVELFNPQAAAVAWLEVVK